MIESKRVYMCIEDKERNVHVNDPIAYVYQMIDNPVLSSTILKEVFLFQEMGLSCQLYLEGQKDD